MRPALTGLLLASALAAHGAPPVAFVADIKGNATIEGNGRLLFLAELPQGSRLLLGSGSTAAVTFAVTGAEFTISGPGEFLVTAVEVKAEKGLPPRRRAVASLPDPSVIARYLNALDYTRLKELAVAQTGLRVVWLAEEADRGRYLLFRDAEMGALPLDPATLQPLMDGLRKLWADLQETTAAKMVAE